MPRVRRSSISGRFVNKAESDANPDSTYVDTVQGKQKDLSKTAEAFLREKGIEPMEQVNAAELPGLLIEFAKSVLEDKK